MDALLTPERLTLVGLLALIIVGFIRGTIHTDKEFLRLKEDRDEQKARGDKYEALLIDAVRTTRQSAATAGDAVKVIEKSLEVAAGRTPNGAGGTPP